TAVLATAKTKSAILGALAVGRNYATMDHNTRVDFSADGHAMGEAFAVPSGIQIAAHVLDATPGDAATLIELYRGVTGVSAPVRIASDVGNSEFHWRELQTFADGTEVIYYLRISINGTRTIWTGPVYVTYDSSIPTAVNPTPVDRLFLGAPYPNPGRGLVSFRLTSPSSDERTEVGVFDLSGRRVRTLVAGTLPVGERTLVWD